MNPDPDRRRFDAGDVRVGASLGNEAIFLRSDARAGMDSLWVAATNRWFFGAARVDLSVGGTPLTHVSSEFAPRAAAATLRGSDVEAIVVLETGGAGVPAALHTITLTNRAAYPVRVDLVAEGCFGARPSALHRRQPAEADVDRAFATEPGPRKNTLAAVSGDGDRLSVTASTGPRPAPDGTGGWVWRAGIALGPGETKVRRLWYRVDSSPPLPVAGMPVRRREGRYPLFGSASREVDLGVYWGAVNAERVLHRYRHGWGFTNDPPGDVLVTRDAAWYVLGADWYAPDVSRGILDTLIRVAPYPSGKIAEYVRIGPDEPIRADYGLNISDATPLFILAACHHAAVTADRDWAAAAYPVVSRAVRHLMRQVRDGFVVCDSRSDEPGSGQCGWRNILSGIRITGAVTELQAESVAALTAWGDFAAWVGDGEGVAAARTDAAVLARGLARLYDERSGAFRLAVDPDEPDSAYGRDDTLDHVFPAMLEVGGGLGVSAQRLNSPAYRTPWGLRTVPSDVPQYHPTAQAGLVGGVWPNATAWASAALASTHPELAWELAADTARLALCDNPASRGAFVYGEFPEFLHGETGENLAGMAMSPWMGPTFVWLAVERLLGLRAGAHGLSIAPALRNDAAPVFARGLRAAGRSLSVLVLPDEVFATMRITCPDRRVRVARDTTARYTQSPRAVVMEWRDGAVAYLAPHTDPPDDARDIVAGMRPGEVRRLGRTVSIG